MHALNSMYVIDHSGTIQDAYDKVHLVPFGEYLPFQDVLESIGLEQLTRISGGFTAGPSRRALSTPLGTAFAPLICYEIIFPGAVMPEGSRPDFLLNVTNDGWFGRTIGPHQHFHQARVRAVEEGLPLVRAANTGISGVTDAYGRVVAASELGAVATIDSRLPLGLAESPFETFRRVSAFLAFAVCLVVPLRRILYPAKDA
jgi:apolipoprotein N-acyltransferase